MLSFVWSRKVGITVDSLLSLATLRHMFTDFLSCVAPLAIQRPICLILVMDGFSVDTIFGPRSWTVRAAGWTIQFTVWISESLSDKDERIVSYATLESMLSPFMLAPWKWQTLPFTWKCLWARRRQQYIVVYKGGHIEKDLLNKLNIPCVDLKEFGCPKANGLLLIGGNVGFVYGHHLHAHTHCSLVECYLFWQWLTKHYLDTHLFWT